MNFDLMSVFCYFHHFIESIVLSWKYLILNGKRESPTSFPLLEVIEIDDYELLKKFKKHLKKKK